MKPEDIKPLKEYSALYKFTVNTLTVIVYVAVTLFLLWLACCRDKGA